MAVFVSYTSGGTGRNFFATAKRLSDGKYWDNNSTVAWQTSPTLANQKLVLVAGASERASIYEATFAAGMGDAGDVLVEIHDDDLSGDLAVDAMPIIHVIGGNEVRDVNSINDSTDAATNLKRSCLLIEYGTVSAMGPSGDSLTTNDVDIFNTNLPLKSTGYYGNANGGQVVCFLDGATNEYQTRRVINSFTDNSATVLQVEEAFNGTPVDSDTFILLGRITELS